MYQAQFLEERPLRTERDNTHGRLLNGLGKPLTEIGLNTTGLRRPPVCACTKFELYRWTNVVRGWAIKHRIILQKENVTVLGSVINSTPP
jgi:hypothetical protein